MRLTIVLAVLLITGCNKYEDPTKKTRVGSNITEIKMDDGTRCIAYHSGYQGGLSCDFSKGEEK